MNAVSREVLCPWQLPQETEEAKFPSTQTRATSNKTKKETSLSPKMLFPQKKKLDGYTS